MAGKWNDVIIWKNSTWSKILTFKSDDIPLDITDYTFKMIIDDDQDSSNAIELTEANGRVTRLTPYSGGQVQFTIPDTITSGINFNCAKHNIWMIDSLSNYQLMVYGNIIINDTIGGK